LAKEPCHDHIRKHEKKPACTSCPINKNLEKILKGLIKGPATNQITQDDEEYF